MLSIGMATSVPSGENAGRRPHEPGRSIVRSVWPVAASRMRSRLKSRHGHVPAVARQRPVAEAVVVVAVVVRDALAGLDVPEPDLAHHHGVGAVLELGLRAASSSAHLHRAELGGSPKS